MTQNQLRNNNTNEEDDPVSRPIFTPRIDAGHILQAVVMAVGAILYVVVVAGRVDDANRKFDDLKVSVHEGLTDLGAKITALPDYAARLTQTERRISDGEVADKDLSRRMDVFGDRLTADEIKQGGVEARVTRLEAGSNVPVRQPH